MANPTPELMRFSWDNLQNISDAADRINKGGVFVPYLNKEGYKQGMEDGQSVYYKDNPEQSIVLKTENGEVRYVNKLLEADKGTFVQFLQNRMIRQNAIIPNDDFPTYLSAVLVAVFNEKQLVKRKAPRKIKPENGKSRKRL